MVNPTFFQRVCSYLYPIQLKGFSSAKHRVLNLQFYRGQWMLATQEAIYSMFIRKLTYARKLVMYCTLNFV